MGRILDRMGWYEIKHEIRVQIVWFILAVTVGTGLEFLPWDQELRWHHILVLAVITHFMARLVVGKDKPKVTISEFKNEDGTSTRIET